MNSSTTGRGRRRRAGAVVTAAALALGGTLAVAAPANAAETTIDDAVFRWGINAESNAAAFAPGTYNLLSAGVVTATSANDRVTEANWKQSEGNVEILKLQSGGGYADATFAGLRTDASGTTITTGNGRNSGHVVEIDGGTGTVDPAAGTAEIQWTGTFTSAFYSGMTRSWITDPHLSVAADGTGTITATLGGYGTSMDDPTLFEQITPVEGVVVATLTGVDVDADGFTVTPDYLGRTVNTGSGTPQVTGGANSGAFPQSFVDFQVLTGQGPYWYSSGGAADARKPAAPLTVGYTATTQPAQPGAPAITVSKTSGIAKGETVTVTGTGFVANAPATNGTRAPLSGQFGGAYVVFGKFASAWKPSEGVASSARTVIAQKWALDQAGVGVAGAQGVLIQADGSFQTELTLSPTQAQDLAAGAYGIYTYAGSGATYAPFETFTPIAFSGANDVIVEVPEWVDEVTGSFGWAFAASTPVNLGTAAQEGANFVAAGTLNDIVVTDTRTGGTAPYTWSISGQVGEFTSSAGSFSSGYLGWTPKVVTGGASISAGTAVTSTQLGGTGLAASRQLASSTAAAGATVGADLSLVIPGTTAAGDYRSTITITALQ